MGFQFGTRSNQNLELVHPSLVAILRRAIASCPIDFTIVWGHRNEDEQETAYRSGNSTKRWPFSKHNSIPSLAVDIAPWPIDWNEEDEFGFISGWIARVAHEMGHEIRWGGTWDLNDCGHIELVT
jgi:hypothetical protein